MAEMASATIAVDQIDSSDWRYTVTLKDTGSTTIGTFWLGWVPGEDFFASSPSGVTAPTGWGDVITHAGAGDGYAIQWTASSPTSDLQAGGSLSGFSFVSKDSPSSVFGDSVFYPGTPVTTSFVYSGGPFSDAGFEFVATEMPSGGVTIILADMNNQASLSDTMDDWDTVIGSNGTVDFSSAQAAVVGGADTLNFVGGSGNAASLYETGNHWDLVNGSNGWVYLNSAQAAVAGGGDTVNFLGGSGNAVSLYGTAGDWDLVNGSNGWVYLNSAQAAVAGGGDTLNFAGGSGNAVSLYGTAGDWDLVNGSNGWVYLNSAQAAVAGGGDTLNFASGSGNAVSLYGTAGDWDSVTGSNGWVYLNSAQAGVAGSGDTINMNGTSSMTQSGASDAFVFQPAIGVETINDFASTDSMQFSTADFMNFSALMADTKQSGANTVIKLDASDKVTLTDFMATSLTSSQFHFV